MSVCNFVCMIQNFKLRYILKFFVSSLPVLSVEKLKPMHCPWWKECWCLQGYLKLPIKDPEHNRDWDTRIHHVEKNHQCIGLGVEKAPDYMGQCFLKFKIAMNNNIKYPSILLLPLCDKYVFFSKYVFTLIVNCLHGVIRWQ